MTVVTLPITPGKHNSFVTLFGPFIADIFAKLTNGSLKIMLNTTHSFRFFKNDTKKYLCQLEHLGIKPVLIECDNSEKYKNYIQFAVKDLFNKGFLQIKNINLVHCDCGIVELPYSVYEILKLQDRQKQIDKNHCVKCGSELMQHKKDILELRLPQKNLDISVYPIMYKGHLQQAIFASERPIIVSRNYRNGVMITLERQTFVLDTDFYWMMYLGYFRDDNFFVISGSDTINQAIMSIKLLNVIQPKSKISFIIHPLLQISNSKIKLSDFTIDNYLQYCKTTRFARSFLALGSQWNKQKVVIKALDLYLIEKSVYPKQNFLFVVEDDDFIIAPQNFCSFFNSRRILELLKIMRSRQTRISISQLALKRVLFE